MRQHEIRQQLVDWRVALDGQSFLLGGARFTEMFFDLFSVADFRQMHGRLVFAIVAFHVFVSANGISRRSQGQSTIKPADFKRSISHCNRAFPTPAPIAILYDPADAATAQYAKRHFPPTD
jgi:hypothetical protein